MTEHEKLPDRVAAIELQIVQLRTEMRDEFSVVRRDIGETRAELNEKHDDALRYMRVLHEDVIGRLAIIRDGQAPRRRKQKEN